MAKTEKIPFLESNGGFGYGPKTEEAVRAYQDKHPDCGTRGEPDGIAGRKTATALGLVWKG